VSRSQEAVKKSKEQYELALLDINNYNSRYMEVNIQYASSELRIRIRDPVPFPPPGSGKGFFSSSRISEFSDNFLGKDYCNSLSIGSLVFYTCSKIK
jgi:hypothetical protein